MLKPQSFGWGGGGAFPPGPPTAAGGLERPPDPSPFNCAPPFQKTWLRPCRLIRFSPAIAQTLEHFTKLPKYTYIHQTESI